jgi:hypothetical protein
MEDVEQRFGSRFEAKAIITAVEVRCVAPDARIVQVGYWNCEEIVLCDHLFADTQAEFFYLFSNVVEKSVIYLDPQVAIL